MINQSGNGIVLIFILLLIIGAYFMVGGFAYTPPKLTDSDPAFEATDVDTSSAGSDATTASADSSLACTHADGICRPQDQASCCPNLRIFCENQKCTGTQPAESTTAGVPAAINPACGPTFDVICKSICATTKGFTCF